MMYCCVWTKDWPNGKNLAGNKLANFDVGQLHRLGGPAFERPDGTREWWVDGKKINTEEVEMWLEENKIDLQTIEDQMAFKLRWM